MTTPEKLDENIESGEELDMQGPPVRQDAYVVFTNDKDLRHHESIRIKSSCYTGIALRVRTIAPISMENLLYAIEIESRAQVRKQKTTAQGEKEQTESQKELQSQNAPEETKEKDQQPDQEQQQVALPITKKADGIINLRFEECKFTRKAANTLADFMRMKQILVTLSFVKCSFEDIVDFKKVMEGVQLNTKLNKLVFMHMNFDDEVYGKSIGRTLMDSRSLRELDISHVLFEHPKCFYDVCSAILSERCRLNILKLRGIAITQLEGKIIQYILMKNKQLHTLDLSQCRTDSFENFEFFFQKLDAFCNIRYLTIENMQPDLSPCLEVIAESLAENLKVEVLIMRENRLKWVNYQNFWNQLMPNKTLKKINLNKTDLTDRVLEKISKYVERPDIALTDLDLSKNLITDAGLKHLAPALTTNQSIKFLNLSQNKLREESMGELGEVLCTNTVLMELSLGGNTITNEGIIQFSKFLPLNTTLQHLDLSRNSFTDNGFETFAELLGKNGGLKFLDVSRNKDLTDDGSLITLTEALEQNRSLKVLDLTSLQIRRPFLKGYFEPALQKNITLQEVIGKIPANIISTELLLNQQIESDILPLYTERLNPKQYKFDLSQIELPENTSFLNLSNKSSKLIHSAFKLIRNYDIRSVDFTNVQMHDDNIRSLASYLRTNPNLRSVTLDENPFTDDGLRMITQELKTNTKLSHLSIFGCPNITDDGLGDLCDVIRQINTCLFQVDVDVDQFDESLATEVINESRLNRDIQEKLKPELIINPITFTSPLPLKQPQIQVNNLQQQHQHNSHQSSNQSNSTKTPLNNQLKVFMQSNATNNEDQNSQSQQNGGAKEGGPSTNLLADALAQIQQAKIKQSDLNKESEIAAEKTNTTSAKGGGPDNSSPLPSPENKLLIGSMGENSLSPPPVENVFDDKNSIQTDKPSALEPLALGTDTMIPAAAAHHINQNASENEDYSNSEDQKSAHSSDESTEELDYQIMHQKSQLAAQKGLNVHQALFEVKFADSTQVSQCFASAIKTWRIYKPNIITLEEQGIADKHVIKLCEFLHDKQMLSRLNLRRNQIGNEGAKSLGHFIHEGDETLTHVDLTRNRIGQDGGSHLLEAISTTTRIVECEITYGNPLSNKMARNFEREIKANIQVSKVGNEEMSQKNSGQQSQTGGADLGPDQKYELIDKGPEYMRCAIKMTELKNILVLSLPDNMLGLEDARMIAALVNKNTNLRTLNLSKNSLNADCAALLANALIYNDNLKELNVSQNVMGDFGIQILLRPLIQRALQVQGLVAENKTAVMRNKDLMTGKSLSTCRRVVQNISVMTNVQLIEIEQNRTTFETFKQLWLLTELNDELRFVVESPAKIQERLDQVEEEKQRKKDVVLFQKKLQDKRKKNKNKSKKQRNRADQYEESAAMDGTNQATIDFDLSRKSYNDSNQQGTHMADEETLIAPSANQKTADIIGSKNLLFDHVTKDENQNDEEDQDSSQVQFLKDNNTGRVADSDPKAPNFNQMITFEDNREAGGDRQEASSQLQVTQAAARNVKTNSKLSSHNNEGNSSNDVSNQNLLQNQEEMIEYYTDEEEESEDSSSSPNEFEDEEKAEQEFVDKLRAEREEKYDQNRRKINCCKKVTCFRDADGQYNDTTKQPTMTQIFCWRFLASRKESHRFYTSLDSLRSFEQSSYQTFVSWILSFNYIMLYTVAIVPFILLYLSGGTNSSSEVDTSDQTDSASTTLLAGASDTSTSDILISESDPVDSSVQNDPIINSEGGIGGRRFLKGPLRFLDGNDTVTSAITEADQEALEEEKEDLYAKFNNIMLIFNGAIIVYSVLCEILLILCMKSRANLRCCNTYLIGQIISGVTMRAVILLSAQLIAAFITQVNFVSYVIGLSLGISLILSQLRAIQIFLAAIKLDMTCLLPRIERNLAISLSTTFLANALIYKKLSAESSKAAIAMSKEAEAEMKRLKKFSGFGDEIEKVSSKKKCQKCMEQSPLCKWSSPKFYQLLLNDIPLLISAPVAYWLEIADLQMSIITLAVTLLDTITMLIYLSYEEQVSIEAKQVYGQISEQNEQVLRQQRGETSERQNNETNKANNTTTAAPMTPSQRRATLLTKKQLSPGKEFQKEQKTDMCDVVIAAMKDKMQHQNQVVPQSPIKS